MKEGTEVAPGTSASAEACAKDLCGSVSCILPFEFAILNPSNRKLQISLWGEILLNSLGPNVLTIQASLDSGRSFLSCNVRTAEGACGLKSLKLQDEAVASTHGRPGL